MASAGVQQALSRYFTLPSARAHRPGLRFKDYLQFSRAAVFKACSHQETGWKTQSRVSARPESAALAQTRAVCSPSPPENLRNSSVCNPRLLSRWTLNRGRVCASGALAAKNYKMKSVGDGEQKRFPLKGGTVVTGSLEGMVHHNSTL